MVSDCLRVNARGTEWIVSCKVNFAWTRHGIHNSEVLQKIQLSTNYGTYEISAPKNYFIVRTDR